jgi:hypothetical protein
MDTTYAQNSFTGRYIFAVFCYVNPDNPLERHYEFTKASRIEDGTVNPYNQYVDLPLDVQNWFTRRYQHQLDATGKTQGAL